MMAAQVGQKLATESELSVDQRINNACKLIGEGNALILKGNSTDARAKFSEAAKLFSGPLSDYSDETTRRGGPLKAEATTIDREIEYRGAKTTIRLRANPYRIYKYAKEMANSSDTLASNRKLAQLAADYWRATSDLEYGYFWDSSNDAVKKELKKLKGFFDAAKKDYEGISGRLDDEKQSGSCPANCKELFESLRLWYTIMQATYKEAKGLRKDKKGLFGSLELTDTPVKTRNYV